MENPPGEMEVVLSPAERMYQNHLKNVAKYQRSNPVKLREKQNRYLAKLRSEPEIHTEFL